MTNESVEEKDMVSSLEHINKFYSSEIESENIIINSYPFEQMKDTDWFNKKQYPKTDFNFIYNYLGKYDNFKKALVSTDLFLFIDKLDLSDKHSLHWSNSSGFAHDKNIYKAISKGISELIENHF